MVKEMDVINQEDQEWITEEEMIKMYKDNPTFDWISHEDEYIN